MLIHIILLHGFSSSNPSINNNSLIISSYPVIFKDSYSSLIAVSILSPVLLYFSVIARVINSGSNEDTDQQNLSLKKS